MLDEKEHYSLNDLMERIQSLSDELDKDIELTSKQLLMIVNLLLMLVEIEGKNNIEVITNDLNEDIKKLISDNFMFTRLRHSIRLVKSLIEKISIIKKPKFTPEENGEFQLKFSIIKSVYILSNLQIKGN